MTEKLYQKRLFMACFLMIFAYAFVCIADAKEDMAVQAEMRKAPAVETVAEMVADETVAEEVAVETVAEAVADKTATDETAKIETAATETETSEERKGMHSERDELIPTLDGGVMYLSLDDVKACLNIWYSEQDVLETTLIVQAEDEIAFSDTIWAAHVWLILDRVGCDGFVNNQNIHAVLSDSSQFSTWTEENLSKTPNPDIEWVVRDVFARKILEDAGAIPEAVGRVLPNDIHFFNTDHVSKYNHFYKWCWGGEYNPFDSPYNPYEN